MLGEKNENKCKDNRTHFPEQKQFHNRTEPRKQFSKTTEIKFSFWGKFCSRINTAPGHESEKVNVYHKQIGRASCLIVCTWTSVLNYLNREMFSSEYSIDCKTRSKVYCLLLCLERLEGEAISAAIILIAQA